MPPATSLVAAAQRIRHATGTEGLCARFGGDEFLVLCHAGDDPGLPERIAGRILDAFSDGFRFGGEEFPVTASIGIARAPTDGETPAVADPERRCRDVMTASAAQRNAWRSRPRWRRRPTGCAHLVAAEEFHLSTSRIAGANFQQPGEMRLATTSSATPKALATSSASAATARSLPASAAALARRRLGIVASRSTSPTASSLGEDPPRPYATCCERPSGAALNWSSPNAC